MMKIGGDAISSSSAVSVPSHVAASSRNAVYVAAGVAVVVVAPAAPVAVSAEAGDSNRVAATASASAWR